MRLKSYYLYFVIHLFTFYQSHCCRDLWLRNKTAQFCSHALPPLNFYLLHCVMAASMREAHIGLYREISILSHSCSWHQCRCGDLLHRICNTSHSSCTHGRLISYLVWPILQRTRHARSWLQLWRKTEEKQLVFLWVWQSLGWVV